MNTAQLDMNFVDKIVHEVKSEGAFDQFRRDSISDVDTKPGYQNLQQRVHSEVKKFLGMIQWTPELNKNQMRERLRRHLTDAKFLDVGIDRIVDQVVNPKINTTFHMKIEEIACKCMGMPLPNRSNIQPPPPPILPPLPPLPISAPPPLNATALLPQDLEQISPDSDRTTIKSDNKSEVMDMDIDERESEDEEDSPPFEPLAKVNEAPSHAAIEATPSKTEMHGQEEAQPPALPDEYLKEAITDSAAKGQVSMKDDIPTSTPKTVEFDKDQSPSKELDAVISQNSQLSRVSSVSNISSASLDFASKSAESKSGEASAVDNVSVNISEEAQMPNFNENSSETGIGKPAELHFDINKDEIKFEGTERKSNLPPPPTPSSEQSDEYSPKVQGNGKSENDNPSFHFDNFGTQQEIFPTQQENSFPSSSLEDTQSSGQLCIAEGSKSEQLSTCLLDAKSESLKATENLTSMPSPSAEPNKSSSHKRPTSSTSSHHKKHAKDRHRSRESTSHRSKNRHRHHKDDNKDKEKDRVREKDHGKEKDKARERSKEVKDKDKEKDRERSKDMERHKERDHKSRDRERSRESSNKDKDKERPRNRETKDVGDHEKERGRSRDREHRRSRHHSSKSPRQSSSQTKNADNKSEKSDKPNSSASSSVSSEKRTDKRDDYKKNGHSESRSNKETNGGSSSNAKRNDRKKHDDHNEKKSKIQRRRNSSDSNDGPPGGSGGNINASDEANNNAKKPSNENESSARTSTSQNGKPQHSSASAGADESKEEENNTLEQQQHRTHQQHKHGSVVILSDILENPNTDFIDMEVNVNKSDQVQVISNNMARPCSIAALQPSKEEESQDLYYFAGDSPPLKEKLHNIKLAFDSFTSLMEKFKNAKLKACHDDENNDRPPEDGDAEDDQFTTHSVDSERPQSSSSAAQDIPAELPSASPAETSSEKQEGPPPSKRLRISRTTSAHENATTSSTRRGANTPELEQSSPPSKRTRLSRTSTRRDIDSDELPSTSRRAVQTPELEDANAGAGKRQRLSKISPTPSETSINSKENEAVEQNPTTAAPIAASDAGRKSMTDKTQSMIKLSQQQRYDSDDLYKPRPVLSQRSRRRGVDSVI